MTSVKRAVACLGLLGLAGAALSAGAPAAPVTAGAIVKPVIAPAVTVPGQAVAGQRITVTFKVTRSDNGRPLTTGRMICDPSSAGKVISHAEAFRSGIARLSFVVPPTAKQVRVKVTIQSGGQSTTRISILAVKQAAKPAVSIGDATVTEGNSGTTAMSFPVTLSTAGAQTVSVGYATADGTATVPGDYAAANGTLTFNPGEKSKTVTVNVVGDTAMEPSETLTVTLGSPVNATIADGTATGTISNDDTQVPVTLGSWKGQAASGDFMYFEVNGDRTMSYFRLNSIRESCSPGGYFQGSLAFRPDIKWPIAADGTSGASNSWSGTDVEGDFTFTFSAYKVTARFNGSTATGTIRLQDNFTWRGTTFTCDTGDVAWTAAPNV